MVASMQVRGPEFIFPKITILDLEDLWHLQNLSPTEDHGKTWSNKELAEHEVWQVRGGPDGTVYAGTQPAGLFRLDTNGHWTEISSFTDIPESGEWCIPVEPKLPGRARALVIDAHDAERLWVGVEVHLLQML